MLKRAALVFGAVFILIGILGFIPVVAPPSEEAGWSLLFGLFAVNAIHNWVHLLSGIVALIVGFRSEAASRMYFRVFGVIYALVALIGIFVGRGFLLGMAHNVPDIFLHVVIAAVALYLGFAGRPARELQGTRRAT